LADADGGSGDDATKSDQNQTEAHLDRGIAYCKKQQWDKAISELSEAAQFNSKEISIYNWRGSAYFAKGDLDKAIADFDYAIGLDPTAVNALFNRAGAYRAKGELDKALKGFNECLRLNPENAEAYKCRAATYHEKGNLDRAILDWSESLRLDPRDSTALAMRGNSYFMKSEFDKALQDYHEAIRLDPNNGEAYNNLAWMRATCPKEIMRDGKSAVEAAKKACELTNWSRSWFVDTLAAAFAEARDFKKAVEFQVRAMRMNDVTDSDRKDMQRCLSLYQKGLPNHEGQRR